MHEKLNNTTKKSQRGSAGVKLLAVGVVLFLIGHAGFNYIPVGFECENYKQKMNEVVMNAYAMPNAPTSTPEAVTDRLRRNFVEHNIPADAFLKVEKVKDGALKAQVYFKKSINILPFGIYRYEYEFNHTASPAGYLAK